MQGQTARYLQPDLGLPRPQNTEPVYPNRWSTGLVNRRSLVRSPARPKFFQRVGDNHCDRIHSSLTACLLFRRWLCGKAVSGLERILCASQVKRTREKA